MLGLQTEQLVMNGLSTFEDRGDHIVQRTQTEPDFWFGNCIILKMPEVPPDRAERLFNAAFPGAAHVCIQWDMPADDLTNYTAAGFEVEFADVLSLESGVQQRELPDGLVLRAPITDADWEALVNLGSEIGVEDGFNPATHRPYLARRYSNRRAQTARGLGKWFCVFDGMTLVASMGVMVSDSLIRFQDVQTRASHRRRGICAGLLGHTCDWALGRSPGATPVIVAEADSAAGRIYRRAGFAFSEQIGSALKRGY